MKQLIRSFFTLFSIDAQQVTIHGSVLHNDIPLKEAFVFLYNKDTVSLVSAVSDDLQRYSDELAFTDYRESFVSTVSFTFKFG